MISSMILIFIDIYANPLKVFKIHEVKEIHFRKDFSSIQIYIYIYIQLYIYIYIKESKVSKERKH